MRPIPAIAAQQCGVFTAEQAAPTGWTPHALRHAVASARLVRLRRGVYAQPIEATENGFADATRRLGQSAAAFSITNRRVPVSHMGAAALLGLPLIGIHERVCATVPRPIRGAISGVHLHRAALPPGHVVRLGRVHLLSTERTVIDLGRELGVEAALAAADFALHHGMTSPEQLAGAVAQCGRWPGVRAAADAIAFADALAESVLESISRLRIHEAGLPAPRPQVHISTVDGIWIGRVDFYWDEYGVVGEADGLAKYQGKVRRIIGEKLRHEELEDTGLIAVRWGWEAYDNFAPVAARLRSAMARGIRPDRAPRRWVARQATLYRRGAIN